MNDTEYEKALLSGDQNTNIKIVKPKEKDTSSGRDEIISSIELKEKIKDLPDEITYNCGLNILDRAIGGVGEGELIALGGLPKNGKTQFSVFLTKKFSEAGLSPLWFSIEMKPRQFIKRFGINVPLFYVPENIKRATMPWLEEKIDESIRRFNSKIVFVDHVGMIADEQLYRSKSPLEVFDERLQQIKDWATNKSICVIVIFPFKQSSFDKKKDRDHFTYSDFRGSSMIAYTADTILVMDRKSGMKNIVALNDLLEMEDLNMSTEADLHILGTRRTGMMSAKVRMIMDDDGNFSEM